MKVKYNIGARPLPYHVIVKVLKHPIHITSFTEVSTMEVSFSIGHEEWVVAMWAWDIISTWKIIPPSVMWTISQVWSFWWVFSSFSFQSPSLIPRVCFVLDGDSFLLGIGRWLQGSIALIYEPPLWLLSVLGWLLGQPPLRVAVELFLRRPDEGSELLCTEFLIDTRRWL